MGLINGFFDTLLSLGSGAGYLGNTASSRVQQRISNKNFPVNLLGEGEYKEAVRLGYIKEKQYYEYMAELGFSETQAKIAYYNTKAHLTALEAVSIRIAQQFELVMNNDNLETPLEYSQLDFSQIKANYYAQCYKIGYDYKEADKLFEANRPIPTKSDIDQFMSKEAFEKKIYTLFGLNQELPDPYRNLMRSYGVPDVETEKYWIAHWNHPSPLQIMDMWFRFDETRTDYNKGILKDLGLEFNDLKVSESHVDEGMKLHEQAPFWINRFKAIGFTNLNITTLQGAYVYGLKPDSWFVGRLKDIGYSTEDAEFVLEVWRRKYPYKSKAQLRTNLFQKIIKGVYTREEAITELEEETGVARRDLLNASDLIKFDIDPSRSFDTWIDYFVDTALDKQYLIKERKIINSVTKLAQKVSMTSEEIKTRIKGAGIKEEYVNEIEQIIQAGILSRRKTYTARDISRAIASKKITEEEALAYYQEINITPEDAAILYKFYKNNTDTDFSG